MNFDCDHINPTGGSGGLLNLWDASNLCKSQTVSTRNYIATSGYQKGFPGTTTLVNVYAPQSIIDEWKLQEELKELKQSLNGIWVFLGDFNVVRAPCERLNSSFCQYTTNDFNRFISNTGLHEFNAGGRKYTFLRDVGLNFSKLDRFLVCQNFVNVQPLTTMTILPREHSDHSPVILKPSNMEFGPLLEKG